MGQLAVVVLAAGQGKRMCSSRPKVLHGLGGRSLLAHVLGAARGLEPESIHVVFGHGGDQVRLAFPDEPIDWVHQPEQLGTGHAVSQAMPGVGRESIVLVLYGDIPLLRPETFQPLLEAAYAGSIGLLTARFCNPTGYGRIVRGDGSRVLRIVEEKDADTEERQIGECSTGIMAAPADRLQGWLHRLSNDNAQGEYYLTDVVAMAVTDGVQVKAVEAEDTLAVQGVNDRVQLAELERHYQEQKARELMLAGVSLSDPKRIDIRGCLETGSDCQIDVNVIFEGNVALGNNVRIGPQCVIRDSSVGDGSIIHPFSLLDSVTVGEDCQIGPFARLRPGADIAEGARIGNFVEVKQSRIGSGSKVNHLSYIGDTELGRNVNIGAGTITCNYDGAHKHRTVIKDEAFIGSNTALVAPVSVGSKATVGAGSTIARDVADCQLSLTRSRQRNVDGWKRPVKPKDS